VVPCGNKIMVERSTDGGCPGMKFFKIILFWHGTTARLVCNMCIILNVHYKYCYYEGDRLRLGSKRGVSRCFVTKQKFGNGTQTRNANIRSWGMQNSPQPVASMFCSSRLMQMSLHPILRTTQHMMQIQPNTGTQCVKFVSLAEQWTSWSGKLFAILTVPRRSTQMFGQVGARVEINY